VLACSKPVTHGLVEGKARSDAREILRDPSRANGVTQSDGERKHTLELAFVGDVVLGEYRGGRYHDFAGEEAPADAFAGVSSLVEVDLLFGNLESPVVESLPARRPPRTGRVFGGSPAAVDALAQAGFDVMSVANNHANDLGREGLEQTPTILRRRGIVPVGTAVQGGPAFAVQTVVTSGWRIGVVSVATWLNHAPVAADPRIPLVRTNQVSQTLVPIIERAHSDHDLIVVLLHWGREDHEQPSALQVEVAHELVDGGADLVIGHHPHVVQGIERYKGGLVAYSLGNFLFPSHEHEYRNSMILRVRWHADAQPSFDAAVEAVRLDGGPGYAPRMATAVARGQIFARLVRLGARLNARWRIHDEAIVIDDRLAVE
jgi:poly-gamma-glutamate synthesis protein (capsule biosynthesis protein)